MKKLILIIIISAVIIATLLILFYKNLFILKSPELNMEIASSAFYHNQEIPKKYTCQGEDINPYLKISEIPDGVKTLFLIVDDPDAPLGTWVHWLVFNIPISRDNFEILEGEIPKGGIEGMNDFKKIGYGGPCPPPGKTHRYFFKAYALDSELNLKEGSSKKQIEKAMKGHIIDSAELVGLYSKQ